MNDALDDILADSDDESEEQAVIDKVLDEIGIEISGKVNIFVILKDQIRIFDWHRCMGLILDEYLIFTVGRCSFCSCWNNWG